MNLMKSIFNLDHDSKIEQTKNVQRNQEYFKLARAKQSQFVHTKCIVI